MQGIDGVFNQQNRIERRGIRIEGVLVIEDAGDPKGHHDDLVGPLLAGKARSEVPVACTSQRDRSGVERPSLGVDRRDDRGVDEDDVQQRTH
ncbi:MAG: hypothetical protein JSU08_06940 [Acidobacteria bacterium]|nr:hypothetical protein [Acidobacteriota bacterium]